MKNTSYEPKRWTKQAIYCYTIGCVCEKCSYNIPLESTKICHTKEAVLELVRILGKPEENLLLAEKGLRRCKCCGKIKRLEEYHHHDGVYNYSYCAKCSNAKGAMYRAKKKREKLLKLGA